MQTESKSIQIICQVCLEGNLDPISLPCSCSFCEGCVLSWIETQVAELQFQQYGTVLCPSQFCKKPFDPSTLLQKLPLPSQNKVNESLLRAYLLKTPDIRLCPNNKCANGGIVSLKTSCRAPLECDSCNYRWREKVHFGFIEKIFMSANSLLLFNADFFSAIWEEVFTNRCPQCEIPILKNGGCEHMTCQRCKWEFCWFCMHRYRGHNPLLCFWTVMAKLAFLFYLLSSLTSVLGLASLFFTLVGYLLKVVACEGATIGTILLAGGIWNTWTRKYYYNTQNDRISQTVIYALAIVGLCSILTFVIWYWSFLIAFLKILGIQGGVLITGILCRVFLYRWMQKVH